MGMHCLARDTFKDPPLRGANREVSSCSALLFGCLSKQASHANPEIDCPSEILISQLACVAVSTTGSDVCFDRPLNWKMKQREHRRTVSTGEKIIIQGRRATRTSSPPAICQILMNSATRHEVAHELKQRRRRRRRQQRRRWWRCPENFASRALFLRVSSLRAASYRTPRIHSKSGTERSRASRILKDNSSFNYSAGNFRRRKNNPRPRLHGPNVTDLSREGQHERERERNFSLGETQE